MAHNLNSPSVLFCGVQVIQTACFIICDVRIPDLEESHAGIDGILEMFDLFDFIHPHHIRLYLIESQEKERTRQERSDQTQVEKWKKKENAVPPEPHLLGVSLKRTPPQLRSFVAMQGKKKSENELPPNASSPRGWLVTASLAKER